MDARRLRLCELAPGGLSRGRAVRWYIPFPGQESGAARLASAEGGYTRNPGQRGKVGEKYANPLQSREEKPGAQE